MQANYSGAVSVPSTQGKNTQSNQVKGDKKLRAENGKHVNTQHIHPLPCYHNHQHIITGIWVPSPGKSVNKYINMEAYHTIKVLIKVLPKRSVLGY